MALGLHKKISSDSTPIFTDLIIRLFQSPEIGEVFLADFLRIKQSFRLFWQYFIWFVV